MMQRGVLLLFSVLNALTTGQQCGRTPVLPNLNNKGVRGITNDIVGGVPAVPYSWPWQIVWCRANNLSPCAMLCGGSIVHQEWVITAGHCVEGYVNSPGLFTVRAGIFNFTIVSKSVFSTRKRFYRVPSSTVLPAQSRNVDRIYLHPQYNSTPYANDIALIHLSTPLTITNQVQPVCLPSTDAQQTTPPAAGWVTGWGTTTDSGSLSIPLRQVNVPFVSYAECQRAYGSLINNAVMICAGQAGKDSCQGDSGGALVAQSNGSWFQYGIVSFGGRCGDPGVPGVYGRMSAWCSWISSTTSGQVTCSQPMGNRASMLPTASFLVVFLLSCLCLIL